METLIINQQNKIYYGKELQQIAVNVCQAAAKLAGLPKDSEVSIMIVDNSYIQELNFIYRKQNRPTDVLSFPMNELIGEEPDYDSSSETNIMGDIVISLEQALHQSEEYGHSLEREFGYLVAHGMLHLMGYDHELEDESKLMRTLEEKIMQMVKLGR
ncbi:MAG: rRNA maturation RNase YbeY [Syntrophomonadaceae bacterium]|jgi:probable rRNA maturation factor